LRAHSRAIYKWINSGCLPRTDYTGETGYASKIAAASGGQFTENQILKSETKSRLTAA
jgi:hypothetical protein